MPKQVSPKALEWTPARLIPTVGIRSQEEQEKRATSSLLAVLAAVPSFGKAVIDEIGGMRGKISTFTEVQLRDRAGKLSIPDGVIVSERGRKRWRCLVEVKTGSAELKQEQVVRYVDLAREHGFDGVVTISNQIRRSREQLPVTIDKRKIGSLVVCHLSWWRLLTAAVLQHRFHGVSDPEQAWILGELIAYMEDERSGASGFLDMGDSWVAVRDGARGGTLRSSDPEAGEVAERWEQCVEFLALGMSQRLGRLIAPAWSKGQKPEQRLEMTRAALGSEGHLRAALRVPDAVSPLDLDVDLRSRLVTTSVQITAPDEGRPLTRINWILRQLREAPGDLRVDVRFPNLRESGSLLLAEARSEPKRLLCASDVKRPPRSFVVAYTRSMGTKRGRGAKSFVDELRQQTASFYRDVVQEIQPWQRKPPRDIKETESTIAGDAEPIAVSTVITVEPKTLVQPGVGLSPTSDPETGQAD